MAAYLEVAASWLFQNFKGRDAKLFTTLPAFSSHAEPTILVTSTDCSTTLGREYMFGGEGRIPGLQWETVKGVQEWLLVSEDPDAPLPTPICHGYVCE